jgi:hypothetical protein
MRIDLKPQKLPPKTDWDRLDELIAWYAKFKPTAGTVIQIRMSAEQLDKRCQRVEGTANRWHYRDRVLERVSD